MSHLNYTTDEYVTECNIHDFIECLQLNFIVKEHDEINDYILSLMCSPLPASNRTITVTAQGEPPQGLEGVKGVFNILIAYYSLENPREAKETEESTVVKKRLGHHNVTAVYTRRKYGTDVRIQINLNEFEPSVVAANEKREAAKKNTAIDPYIETNDTGFSQLFADSLMNQPQKETKMNLEQIATQLTEMGVTDFWGSMFMHLANEAGYSGDHDVKFEKLSDSIAVSFGECQCEMDTQRVVIEALNQDLSINTYTDGAVFLVPVTVTTLKKPTQRTKTQDCDAPVGKDMTAEEIGKVLLDTGVNQAACEETVRILIRKGFIRAIPNVSIARVKDKVDFIFGDYVVAPNIEPTEKGEMLGFVYSIWLPLDLRVGCFSYNIANQKETKMNNEQTPTDTDLIWKKFREQLEAAKLSQQSINLIMHTLRDDAGLKKPTAESVLLCTKGRNVTNVYYSHAGKHVTLTDAEKTHLFDDRETLSYGAGHHDAFFIADTSKVKTFEEKMIHRHVGVPKIALHLSNGKSIELPFKKEYIKVTESAVMIHLDCSVGVSLTNKELNSLTGWALTDLNEVEKSRFFVNGREYTVEEFNEKINPRKQEGAVNPGAGSWADIAKA